jgi:hypothetical protein
MQSVARIMRDEDRSQGGASCDFDQGLNCPSFDPCLVSGDEPDVAGMLLARPKVILQARKRHPGKTLLRRLGMPRAAARGRRVTQEEFPSGSSDSEASVRRSSTCEGSVQTSILAL